MDAEPSRDPSGDPVRVSSPEQSDRASGAAGALGGGAAPSRRGGDRDVVLVLTVVWATAVAVNLVDHLVWQRDLAAALRGLAVGVALYLVLGGVIAGVVAMTRRRRSVGRTRSGRAGEGA